MRSLEIERTRYVLLAAAGSLFPRRWKVCGQDEHREELLNAVVREL